MSEIDVNKCEYYDNGDCNKYYNIECSDYAECIYKKLLKYKQCLDEIEAYCNEQNLKYDTTACDILQKIDEVKGNE